MTFFPLDIPKTQPGDVRTAESISHIDLTGINGTSVLRNIVTETASATVVTAGGETNLKTTASGTDACSVDSTERVRFNAGSQVSFLITGRRPTAPAGSQSYRAGAFDANNGFGFGEDATSGFIFDRSGGTETLVRQSAWNQDKLDGTGASGLTADFAAGVFLIVDFDCYCYGVVNYKLKVYDSSTGTNVIVTVHKLRKTGEVQTENPNVPVRIELENGGTATAFDIFFGVRSFRSFTPDQPDIRFTGQYRLNQVPTTTFIPVVSFRRKTAFTHIKALVDAYEVITDTDLIIQIRVNGSLTGASYTTPSNYTAAETAMEVDVSATAITGGEVIWESLGFGGAKNKDKGSDNEGLVNLDIPETQPVTLCVRTTTGSATRIDSVFRMSETW